MRVVFTGVGEAFDERLGNSSLLVRPDSGMVLLDCGFTAPFAFWRCALDAGLDPMDLGAVWISHLHGDHFMGLPALLLRLREEGRSQPLTIVGPTGTAEAVLQATTLAYASVGRGLREGKPFAAPFVEAGPGRTLHLAGLTWRFAATDHLSDQDGEALALRLDEPDRNGTDLNESGQEPGASLFYSGDGRPTDATRALARGCGLVVHEAYCLGLDDDADVPGHGSVQGALGFAREAGAAALALVHINRAARHGRRADMEGLAAQAARVPGGPLTLIPEPGDAMDVPPATMAPVIPPSIPPEA